MRFKITCDNSSVIEPRFARLVHYHRSHSAGSASLGIRQSPRGERLTVPTLGPSGTHDRLYCWRKNRVIEGPHRPLDQFSRVGLSERGVLAQEEDLLGRITASDRVEEDEVVQLVRAEHRLGGLLDLARGRGRQQLGRDGRLDDREQAFPGPAPRETRSGPRSGPGTSPASWGSSNWGCTCSCGRHYTSTSPAPAPRGRRCRRRTPWT